MFGLNHQNCVQNVYLVGVWRVNFRWTSLWCRVDQYWICNILWLRNPQRVFVESRRSSKFVEKAKYLNLNAVGLYQQSVSVYELYWILCIQNLNGIRLNAPECPNLYPIWVAGGSHTRIIHVPVITFSWKATRVTIENCHKLSLSQVCGYCPHFFWPRDCMIILHRPISIGEARVYQNISYYS